MALMKLKQILLQSPNFVFHDNIFYQRNIQLSRDFETAYLNLREKEHRLYSDDQVRILPEIALDHPTRKEWIVRKITLKRLMCYLRTSCIGKSPAILEVGCGNGWLCNHLATIDDSDVLGMDVNEMELRQGARTFKDRRNLCFAYSDVMASTLPFRNFDYIVLAASLQYFKDFHTLLQKLIGLLAKWGEIHLLDTPLYNARDLLSAQARSTAYFEAQNCQLKEFYYHHTWESLNKFEYHMLYNPDLLKNRILGLFMPISRFPWLRLKPHCR